MPTRSLAPLDSAPGIRIDAAPLLALAVSLLWASSAAAAGPSFQGLDNAVVTETEANEISDDGTVVVGKSNSAKEAFAWDSVSGSASLGDLPGGKTDSTANYVSADGSVIVGKARSTSGEEAFMWDATNGMVGLGDLAGGKFSSEAMFVSADGTLIFGKATSASGKEGFVWDSTSGMVALGDLAGGKYTSDPKAITPDGSVVVGKSESTSGKEAFMWDATNGMVGLGDLAGGAFESQANYVSADGSVIVGKSISTSGKGETEAFKWDATNGMVGLGDLAGGDFSSEANFVSDDGTVIVGKANSTSGKEAFVWDSASGMVGIGDLPGGDYESVANAISSDGSVVVGKSKDAGGDSAFIWDVINGIRDLKTVLEGLGLDLTGWTLSEATAITPDGLTLTGKGNDPGGVNQSWIAFLGDPSGAEDHFSLTHDGAGINCLAEAITATVKDAVGATVTDYTGAITLDTQTGTGSWSLSSGSGTFADATAGDGLATYTFAAADNGVATFLLTYSVGAGTIDVDAYETGNPTLRDDDLEGSLVFSPSGFTVTASALSNPPPNPIIDPIGSQTAGTAFALHLTAFGQTPTDPTCGVIEAYTGGKSLKFWSTYSDPSTGTVSVSIDGSGVASAEASASAQAVSFASGQASVSAKYKDVGRIQISIKDDTVAEPAGGITGATALFVVKPANLVITSVQRPDTTANPGASTPSGTIFVAAGTAFRVTVEVRDSEGSRTPNYGNESTPEGLLLTASTLVAPAAGRNGSNDDGAIGNGSSFAATAPAGTFTGAGFSWDEVGAIRLRVSIADADYLAAGDVLGSESGDVGRFTPNDFDVAVDTAPVFATVCASGGFSYQGQPFVYGTAPVLAVTARSAGATTTQNYAGAWWKLTNASLGDPTYASDPGAPATLDTSGLPDPSTDPLIVDLGGGTGTLSFDAGTGLRFDRSSPVAPFDAELSLGIDVIDADGVAYASNPFQVGSATPGNGITFSAGKTMRYGRLMLGNAHDSELVTLAVPLRAEYYGGSGFVVNTDDGCTSIGTANFGTTARSPVGLATTPAISNVPLSSGEAGLTLSPPGQEGYADLLVNLSGVDVSTSWGTITGADLPWLQFDWTTDGAGLPDDDPTARATFGIYPGQAPVIFRLEIY